MMLKLVSLVRIGNDDATILLLRDVPHYHVAVAEGKGVIYKYQ